MKRVFIMAMAIIMIFAFAACTPADNANTDGSQDSVSDDTQGEDDASDGQSSQDDTTDDQVSQGDSADDQSNQQSASNEKIQVYISGPEAMITKLEEAFEEENGDVLDMTILSCGQLRSKVWAESQAGSIQADVVWGSDPLVFNKLNDGGFLEPLEIKDIDNVDPGYVWEGKNYALVSERYITIVYNSSLFKDEPPTSYADLTDTRFKGILTMADGSQSSTAFAIASSLYELEGGNDDYFSALKENGIMLTKSNGLVPSTIMEGQFSVGISPYDSIVRLNNKGKKEGFEVPVEVVWPSEGVIAVQRPIAIPVNEDRSEAKEAIAKKFVNFIVSKKAQTITTNFGFVSVRSDIENKYLPEGVKVYSVDWEAITANEDAIKDEYQSIFH